MTTSRIWRRRLSPAERLRRLQSIAHPTEPLPDWADDREPCPVIELYPQGECNVCALVGQTCCRRHQGELK